MAIEDRGRLVAISYSALSNFIEGDGEDRKCVEKEGGKGTKANRKEK